MPINTNPRDRAFRTRVERQKQRNKIAKILEQHKQEVEARCKISQLGIGFKVKNAKISKEIGILAFVEKKLTENQLKKKQIEPIEKIIKETTTDVVEFPSGIQPSGVEYNKISGGIPARHYQKSGSGTLGIILKKTKESSSSEIQIPRWIKNNAKWWSEGKISDDEFVDAIKFLIKEGIIVIPPTATGGFGIVKIPTYVKNNAGLWAENKISDADFVNGIQYLIKQNIIKIPITQVEELFALTNSHVGAIVSAPGTSPSKENDVWTFPRFSGYNKSPLKGPVAKLEKWNEILSDPNSLNYFDAALAKISYEWKNDVIPYEIIEIGNVKGMEDAEIGDQVLKYGKSSNLTEGVVAGIVPHPQKITINYNGTNCDFTDQIIIIGNPSSKPFSESGDSGSLVVSKETDSDGSHAAIALLFSGAFAANGTYYAFANPIKRIAEDFQLAF